MKSKQSLPSNKSFGILFSSVFGSISIYAYINNNLIMAVILAVFTSILIFITMISPKVLVTANRLWMNFGLLLGRLISPIVIGVIFFILITPVAILLRLTGRDILKIKRPLKTNWVGRQHSVPSKNSFKKQF